MVLFKLNQKMYFLCVLIYCCCFYFGPVHALTSIPETGYMIDNDNQVPSAHAHGSGGKVGGGGAAQPQAEKPPGADCAGSWELKGDAKCSKECGGGLKAETFVIHREREEGAAFSSDGKKCQYEAGETRGGSTACNTQPCKKPSKFRKLESKKCIKMLSHNTPEHFKAQNADVNLQKGFVLERDDNVAFELDECSEVCLDHAKCTSFFVQMSMKDPPTIKQCYFFFSFCVKFQVPIPGNADDDTDQYTRYVVSRSGGLQEADDYLIQEANSRPDTTVKDQAEEMGKIQGKAGDASQTSIALDEVAEVAEITKPDNSVEVPTENLSIKKIAFAAEPIKSQFAYDQRGIPPKLQGFIHPNEHLKPGDVPFRNDKYPMGIAVSGIAGFCSYWFLLEFGLCF